jgi:hypothetical protein
MKNFFVLVALFLGTLVGCVPPEPLISITASGKPEVTIRAELAVIKSEIIGDLVNYGYTVEQDNDYTLRTSRPLKGNEEVLASVFIGNSYSTNRRVHNYTFVKTDQGVRIIVSAAITAQMPGGQVNSSELTTNSRNFNDIQRDLNALKTRIESR